MFCFIQILILAYPIMAFTNDIDEEGTPVKYISSCKMDFNNDKRMDISLLLDTDRGRELIVLLLNSKNKYESHNYIIGDENIFMSCYYGNEVKESKAFNIGKKQKTFKTNGTYIMLFQPESAAYVLYWEKSGFRKVWISD